MRRPSDSGTMLLDTSRSVARERVRRGPRGPDGLARPLGPPWLTIRGTRYRAPQIGLSLDASAGPATSSDSLSRNSLVSESAMVIVPATRTRWARSCLGKLPLLSGRLTAPHGIETPRQLPRTLCAPSADREMSHHAAANHTRPPPRP